MLGNLMHTEKDPQAHGYQSLLGIFMHIEKDPQAHGYQCIFHREYSKVSISTGNVKCARRIRNVQGKGNYRVERDLGFSMWSYLVEGLLYFTYFGEIGPFQLSKRLEKQ
jgi:hypothetical protein